MSNNVLTRAWEDVQAGRISWDEARAIQAEMMPRCDECRKRPALGIVGRRPLCEVCYATKVGQPLPSGEPTTKGVRRG